MSNNTFIDYGKLIDDAMHVIVKRALGYVGKDGLPGKHHFFISFITSHPGVRISPKLREKYPEEMTIVIQHQFEDLQVRDDYFSVVLSFDNEKQKIQIPFDALIAFADPSVKFGLQFSHLEEKQSNSSEPIIKNDAIEKNNKTAQEANIQEETKPKKGKKGKGKSVAAVDSNVVDIDTFRKK